jgi:phosphate starvation-inducible PhoH-like protein
MKDSNRERKGEIKAISKVTLNEEQRAAKSLIWENDITIITGRAGTGKSLVTAQTALDLLFKKRCGKIIVTRAMIEVGDDSMGFLPGGVGEKFNPYIEAFMENLEMCTDRVTIENLILTKKIIAGPVNFVRGKTINDVLVIEEGQNMDKFKMLSLLTRLGQNGKIIVNGDFSQNDTKNTFTGLHYCKELTKHIPEIKYVDLKENHRHGLVAKILEYEEGKEG